MREHPLIFLVLLFTLLAGIALGCGIVLATQALYAEAQKSYQIAEKYREGLSHDTQTEKSATTETGTPT